MKKTLRQKLNNSGAAMVVAIIVIAVLMVFVFSLVLISYNLYASQNKNIATMMNNEAANSLSRALRDDLCSEKAGLSVPDGGSNFYKYLRFNVLWYDNDNSGFVDWPYYDSETDNKDAAYRYFDFSANGNIKGMPDSIYVCVYWTLPPKDNFENKYVQAINNSGTQINDLCELITGTHLYIDVVCESGSQSYKVSDEYVLYAEPLDSTTDEKSELLTDLSKVTYNPAGHYMENGVTDYSDKLWAKQKWTWVHVSK